MNDTKSDAQSKQKSPAFQFYPRDWLTDIHVVMMTPEERGLYIIALCHDWLENGLTEEHLGRLCMTGKGSSSLVRARFEQHPTNLSKFTNPRLQKEREKQAAWSAKCREGGINSGKSRHKASKGSSDLVRSKRELNMNTAFATASASTNTNTITPPVSPRGDLKKFGEKFLSMTDAQMKKCLEKYGKPLIDQELPNADEWIAESDTPNGRKYRKPGYNHYLFFSSTWMKSKRLESTGNFPQKLTPAQKTVETVRSFIEREQNLEAITHEKV